MPRPTPLGLFKGLTDAEVHNVGQRARDEQTEATVRMAQAAAELVIRDPETWTLRGLARDWNVKRETLRRWTLPYRQKAKQTAWEAGR
jgi:hypothetical protein